MKNFAIITAGGVGSRMGQDVPKQFLSVKNKPIIIYTLEIFQKHPEVDGIIVACLEGWEGVLEAYAKQFNITKLKKIVKGGEDGQASIKNCLDAIDGSEDKIVIIHDGNRPMLSADIISNALAGCKKNGNAIAAIPCPEVLMTTDDGETASGMIDRDIVKRTQTPHVFYLKDILAAHKEAEKRKLPRSAASCALYEMLGKKVFFVDGSEKNLKLTYIDDLDVFKALLKLEESELE
ncbi:2-C-methyl-D-erythritol 4-phosphate cytidylyltransferase [Candidatus Saccharibacteria bacterium]|nr:2-C-methyl-D-erythritol 4-phosphate cytidylyltransferase [Candidatus Saccharibacteria bacterium]